MEVEFPKYAFALQYFDTPSMLLRDYIIQFYTERGEIDIYDCRAKRMILRKTLEHKISLSDLYVGNKILVNGRQYDIVDYADEFTRKTLGNQIQSTYAMIKPGYSQYLGETIERINKEGLQVAKLRMGYMYREIAAKFYAEHQGKPFYDTLVRYMTSGPIVAMELVGQNAIAKWRQIIGPTNLDNAKAQAPESLRARFARSTTENFAHGSDSPESAKRELGIIFGDNSIRLVASHQESTLCVVKPHIVKENLAGQLIQMITKAGYQIVGAAMESYDIQAANEFYECYRGVIDNYMEITTEFASGPLIGLELKKEGSFDVVRDFRELVGPIDIKVAKVIRPESIRAKFGKNQTYCAVHCTDIPEEAEIETRYFFELFDH
ncbi:Nucleoside diphosphate kinase family protein [Trichomonas vaginalis G3]|uniref:Nucleoside diphosphate kinase n=1 Tax=Trichomonas vaginalis (strain ATCC PRA-98 / G3) TaxID=412133 RepID=A2EFN0_TRIV3|nr:nucleoside diphosphate kinase family [Trichomonas vaginalis G3]EAY08525.1 Nucleoside diphosphate kinase family protein [Trichomonas vaginalis G3]KAI5542086.1 nucleoside diphosphate kinase family [Trichomonas vaginalis G3]|eukprot:XP_001320748.1 Nucleoside diphosphate kinase family protein [Trichomonas vaginalis G3]